MKVIENTGGRFVAQNKAIGAYILGAVGVIGGVVLLPLGLGRGQVGLWGTGIAALGIGILIILLTKSELLTADVTAGTITVVTKGIIGGKNVSFMIAEIASIRGVQVYRQVSTGNNNSGSGVRIGNTGSPQLELDTTTQLVMTDGTSVEIERTSHSANTSMFLSRTSTEGIGRPLATAIGKPYELISPNSNPMAIVGAAMSAIRGESANTQQPSVVAPVTPQPAPVITQPAVPVAQNQVQQPNSAMPVESTDKANL